MAKIGGIVCLVLLTAACTTDTAPTTTTSPLPPPITSLAEEERAYLEAAGSIERDLVGGFVGIGDALGRVYNTREAIFGVVEDAGMFGLVENTQRRAVTLEPPARFAADHAVWIAFHDRLELSMRDLRDALDGRDLGGVIAVNGGALQERAKMILGVSPVFCREVAAQEIPDLCPSDNQVGGEYGRAVYDIVRLNMLQTSGLFEFPLDMTPEETSARLRYVQPFIEGSLIEARDSLQTLDPPPAYSAGHQILLTYYTEQSQNAVAITDANEQGDMEIVFDLFDRSGEVADALSQLSDQYRELIPRSFLPG